MMMGQPQRHFQTIGSTNDAAREWARDGAPHGAIVTADAQTSGRGRRGREWSSPAAKGLYLSLIVRPDDGLEIVPRLTMLAALAVRSAVQAIDRLSNPENYLGDPPPRDDGFTDITFLPQPLDVGFKWPNDVLLHGHKIAGVLCEAEWKGALLDFAVVGVGVNANLEADDLPPRPIYPASSLLLETGRAWNLAELREDWLREFETVLQMSEDKQWPLLREDFWNHCAQRGNFVKIASEAEIVQGIATGLDEDGALLVQTGTALRRVLAGDVSPLTAES